jgi:hypothetical protein
MENFDFKRFVEDSKQALLNPQEYFETMSTEGGFGPPLIKALIYGIIAGIFALLWSLLRIGGVGGMFFGTTFGFMALISAIIGTLIGLFIGAVIILILVSIAGGKTDFEPILHVTAALLVVTPVMAFLNVFSALSPFLGSLISLAVNLWMLWMLFNAMTRTLGSAIETSKIIMYVLGGILILFFFIGLATRRLTRSTMRRYYDLDHSHQIENAPVNNYTRTFTGFYDGVDS